MFGKVAKFNTICLIEYYNYTVNNNWMRGVHSRNFKNSGIMNSFKTNRVYNEKDRCYEIEESNIAARILAKRA